MAESQDTRNDKRDGIGVGGSGESTKQDAPAQEGGSVSPSTTGGSSGQADGTAPIRSAGSSLPDAKNIEAANQGPNGSGEKNAPVVSGLSAERQAAAMTHANKVLEVSEKGLQVAVQQSSFVDDQTLRDSFVYIVPTDFRESALPILAKLNSGDVATLLAYLAVTWHDGYKVGQDDLAAAVTQGGHEDVGQFLQNIVASRRAAQ